MPIARRSLLHILAFAVAPNLLLPRSSQAAALPEQPLQPDSSAQEKVLGIGGLFFRAHNPAALASWYQQHLGINLTPTKHGDLPWQQSAGPTAFAPFSKKTSYFGDPSRQWMVNFRVANLDRLATQLRAASIAITIDPEISSLGRFARIHDPEGNPIELWQPATPPEATGSPAR